MANQGANVLAWSVVIRVLMPGGQLCYDFERRVPLPSSGATVVFQRDARLFQIHHIEEKPSTSAQATEVLLLQKILLNILTSVCCFCPTASFSSQVNANFLRFVFWILKTATCGQTKTPHTTHIEGFQHRFLTSVWVRIVIGLPTSLVLHLVFGFFVGCCSIEQPSIQVFSAPSHFSLNAR